MARQKVLSHNCHLMLPPMRLGDTHNASPLNLGLSLYGKRKADDTCQLTKSALLTAADDTYQPTLKKRALLKPGDKVCFEDPWVPLKKPRLSSSSEFNSKQPSPSSGVYFNNLEIAQTIHPLQLSWYRAKHGSADKSVPHNSHVLKAGLTMPPVGKPLRPAPTLPTSIAHLKPFKPETPSKAASRGDKREQNSEHLPEVPKIIGFQHTKQDKTPKTIKQPEDKHDPSNSRVEEVIAAVALSELCVPSP